MKIAQSKKVLSVIIPVYNEEEFVVALLDKVLHARVSVSMEILIVNDGSTDRSGELCQEWIRSHRDKTAHRLIYLEKSNGGKGSAVKAGIARSTGDVVIIQDADLEYDPADYEKCIRPILHGECHVVYGSREKENRNRIFHHGQNIFLNKDHTDLYQFPRSYPLCQNEPYGQEIHLFPLSRYHRLRHRQDIHSHKEAPQEFPLPL